jgi:LacI family transcriptional regulator
LSVTIKDVAQKANCSIKTVSRVVNDEPHVRTDLRERVLNAIEELGYAPNISARRLVQKRSYVICVLLHSSGSFQSALISKILDLGYEGNYEILVQTYYPSFSRSRKKIASLINEQRIDGLVTTPPCDSDPYLQELIKKTNIAHVHIAPLNPTGGTPYVSAEDFSGAYQMTEYLIQKGHRKIAVLLGHRNQRPSLDRLFGYRAALEKYDIPFLERYLIDSENNFEGGYTATRILMSLTDAPTALFALSDESAAGSIYALNELNITVPSKVALAVFGDLSSSQQIWPGITAIRYPIEGIVENAVQMLIEIVEGKQPLKYQVILPTNLVIRGTT